MSIWDTYPETYRQVEVERILRAVQGGECVSLVGLSGAGKSNLLGFLAHRLDWPGHFALVDLNRLPTATAQAFWELLMRSLEIPLGHRGESALEAAITAKEGSLCLLLDRFDALEGDESAAAARGLRALRDANKYRLTFVTATRRPLDPLTELAELVYAHTLILGTLSDSDADWNVRRYAQRLGLDWDTKTSLAMRKLTNGYPALLRGVCEAHASGCPLQIADLRRHPAVHLRLDEFWQDSPTPDLLRRSGLSGLPLIERPNATPRLHLTTKEKKLFAYLQEHAGDLCEKDDLIQAVWPEDVIYSDGVHDASLAQLVSRLRRKITALYPESRLENVPGQGYVLTLGISA